MIPVRLTFTSILLIKLKDTRQSRCTLNVCLWCKMYFFSFDVHFIIYACDLPASSNYCPFLHRQTDKNANVLGGGGGRGCTYSSLTFETDFFMRFMCWGASINQVFFLKFYNWYNVFKRNVLKIYNKRQFSSLILAG